MLLNIANVLGPEGLEETSNALEKLTWYDGKKTAGGAAKSVKSNEQADLTSAAGQALSTAVMAKLRSHSVLQAAAYPAKWSRLIFSRTENSGHYGAHIDNAIMAAQTGQMRTDLSFTLFLSDPETYDGGELVIHFPGYRQSVKPMAGDLVLYPTSQIHEVTPVTRGVRVVCVGWIQSRVQDPQKREILFDMANLRAALSGAYEPHTAEMLTLNKSIGNLKRLWSQL